MFFASHLKKKWTDDNVVKTIPVRTDPWKLKLLYYSSSSWLWNKIQANDKTIIPNSVTIRTALTPKLNQALFNAK